MYKVIPARRYLHIRTTNPDEHIHTQAHTHRYTRQLPSEHNMRENYRAVRSQNRRCTPPRSPSPFVHRLSHKPCNHNTIMSKHTQKHIHMNTHTHTQQQQHNPYLIRPRSTVAPSRSSSINFKIAVQHSRFTLSKTTLLNNFTPASSNVGKL
jgi:hypothetical protein